jgi:hypothetical protein
MPVSVFLCSVSTLHPCRCTRAQRRIGRRVGAGRSGEERHAHKVMRARWQQRASLVILPMGRAHGFHARSVVTLFAALLGNVRLAPLLDLLFPTRCLELVRQQLVESVLTPPPPTTTPTRQHQQPHPTPTKGAAAVAALARAAKPLAVTRWLASLRLHRPEWGLTAALQMRVCVCVCVCVLCEGNRGCAQDGT